MRKRGIFCLFSEVLEDYFGGLPYVVYVAHLCVVNNGKHLKEIEKIFKQNFG